MLLLIAWRMMLWRATSHIALHLGLCCTTDKGMLSCTQVKMANAHLVGTKTTGPYMPPSNDVRVTVKTNMTGTLIGLCSPGFVIFFSSFAYYGGDLSQLAWWALGMNFGIICFNIGLFLTMPVKYVFTSTGDSYSYNLFGKKVGEWKLSDLASAEVVYKCRELAIKITVTDEAFEQYQKNAGCWKRCVKKSFQFPWHEGLAQLCGFKDVVSAAGEP